VWPMPCVCSLCISERKNDFVESENHILKVKINKICFTICLFISPDLDGHSAPQNGSTIRFKKVMSLDLDGYVSRYDSSTRTGGGSNVRELRNVSRYVCVSVRAQGKGPENGRECFHDMFVLDICFTICLFISPDLEGYRYRAYIDPARPRKL